MNRTRLLDVFAPRYHSLFPSIEKSAEYLVLSAEGLEILLQTSDFEKQSGIVSRLNELQTISDSLTNDTYSLLRSLIIIPFDKNDINQLVNQINYLLESVNNIARMLHSGRIGVKLPIYNELAGIVTSTSKELSVCCSYFRNAAGNKSEISACCDNISNYEKSANEIFYSVLFYLIENGEQKDLLIKKKILEMFMNCIHQSNMVTKVIKEVVIKAV